MRWKIISFITALTLIGCGDNDRPIISGLELNCGLEYQNKPTFVSVTIWTDRAEIIINDEIKVPLEVIFVEKQPDSTELFETEAIFEGKMPDGETVVGFRISDFRSPGLRIGGDIMWGWRNCRPVDGLFNLSLMRQTETEQCARKLVRLVSPAVDTIGDDEEARGSITVGNCYIEEVDHPFWEGNRALRIGDVYLTRVLPDRINPGWRLGGWTVNVDDEGPVKLTAEEALALSPLFDIERWNDLSDGDIWNAGYRSYRRGKIGFDTACETLERVKAFIDSRGG